MNVSPHKAARIAWFEFYNTITRRSVLLVMFGLPLVTLVVFGVINRLAAPPDILDDPRDAGSTAATLLNEILVGESQHQPSGLVDEGHLLTLSPEGRLFRSYESEGEAAADYAAGELLNYYVIPADYLQSREMRQYAANRSYVRENQEQYQLFRLLSFSLIGDLALAERISNPATFSETDITPSTGLEPENNNSFSNQFLIIFGVAMLFFVTTMGASGYLLQSLGKEKQSRVLEILLSSMNPSEMLLGKIVGLGAMGFVQLAVWSIVVLLLLGRGSSLFGNLPLPQLTGQTWLLVASFFVGGYFVYASLYAGLGALSPNPKEGSQYAFLIVLPVLLPLWFNNIFWRAPDGALATAFSLFPLSAPLAMPMRMLATSVPPWQIALSLALIVATAALIISVVARLFRGQVLVSGQSLTPRYIWRTLRG